MDERELTKQAADHAACEGNSLTLELVVSRALAVCLRARSDVHEFNGGKRWAVLEGCCRRQAADDAGEVTWFVRPLVGHSTAEMCEQKKDGGGGDDGAGGEVEREEMWVFADDVVVGGEKGLVMLLTRE